MRIKILSPEINTGISTTVYDASVVRLYNTSASVGVVTRTDANSNIIGNFTLSGGEIVYTEKSYSDKLIGNSNIKAVKIAYGN